MCGSRTGGSSRSAGGRRRGRAGDRRRREDRRSRIRGLHTHYDAQIRWDPWCTISGWHGVTSVVLGNCGFGFAPCRPDFRDRSMLTMTRTEAIPYESMRQGMNWDWETIPEYLDCLDRAPKGVNFIQYMPTASLMTYVMGLEAAKSRPATDRERKEMQRLLHEGMDAGLCGFSIQRLGDTRPGRLRRHADGDRHHVRRGHPGPGRGAGRARRGLHPDHPGHRRHQGRPGVRREAGGGGPAADPLQRGGRRPRTEGPPQQPEVARADREKGLPIFAQSAHRRAGFAFTLEHWNLYDASPAWHEATTGTKEEKLAEAAGPRDARAVEGRDRGSRGNGCARANAVGGDPEPRSSRASTASQTCSSTSASRSATSPRRRASTRSRPCSTCRSPATSTSSSSAPSRGSNVENMGEMMSTPVHHPRGIRRRGPHQVLHRRRLHHRLPAWLVRDEKKIRLEEAHYRLSNLAAQAAGFHDRGVLREGAPADVVVYDLERLEDRATLDRRGPQRPAGRRMAPGAARPRATRRSSSTARSPSRTASARAQRPASSSATGGDSPAPVWRALAGPAQAPGLGYGPGQAPERCFSRRAHLSLSPQARGERVERGEDRTQ